MVSIYLCIKKKQKYNPMNHFLTAIQINKLFHLHDIKIDIDKKEKKHLLITGKNGCGKTSLLKEMEEFLQRIKSDKYLSFINIEQTLINQRKYLENIKQNSAPENQIYTAEEQLKNYQNQYDQTLGKLNLSFTNLTELAKHFHNKEFLFAVYEANRKTQMHIPTNPEKPNLQASRHIKESKRQEFVKFLIDLKIQEALARNENQVDYADEIRTWFNSFEELLSDLFESDQLKLKFNFRSYAFTILQDDKEFNFNQLSDGYSAVIDIIADLILKMQDPKKLIRAYQMPGIVLIDEIETHLHLELQKAILPLLTRVFPNIQFIVTTHSPFVLNSIDNAVAYDLQKQERLDDLHEYSYEALAEGYFDVSTESSFLDHKLNRFESLLKKTDKDSAEQLEQERLDKELQEALSDVLTPDSVKIRFQEIKLNS